MDTITQQYEIADALLEGEDLDEVLAHAFRANGGERRHYSAEVLWDVLDPYTAVIEGVPAPTSKP